MIFLDALVFNPGRHTANFGLLRDKTTGEFLGLASCFDHNMALFARGYPSGKWHSDLLITLFTDLMKVCPQYWALIPVVTEDIIEEALKQTRMKVKSQIVRDYILFRYLEIMKAKSVMSIS